jgi:hypothetical protein
MAEFGDNAGEFVRNLIHSLQEEAERLPSPASMFNALREFDPKPEQITDIAAKCSEAVTAIGKVLAGMVQGARDGGEPTESPMPDHIDIPDDLSGL